MCTLLINQLVTAWIYWHADLCPQAERVILEMQDLKTGVKSQLQRLVITTIPHAITGQQHVHGSTCDIQ